MLTTLSITNLLLLKSCTIDFTAGLNVLTGETGAGKSILLDALGLVLGERSDASLVRSGEAQASVSATFETNAVLRGVLAELDLPDHDELILRRTLNADGKSKAFVNDVAVSVAALKRIGERLVERHGQHDQRGLLEPKTHRALIDAYAEHEKQLAKTAAAFAALKEANAALEALKASLQHAAAEQEWLQLTVHELLALNPREGEEADLVEARKAAQTAQQSIAQLQQALELISASGGMAPRLRQASKLLAKAEGVDSVLRALEQAENQVEEANIALEKMVGAAEIDPEELQQAEDRLYGLRDAARKYRVPVDGLAALLTESQQKLAQLTHSDAALHRVTQQAATAKADYIAAASALHLSREKAAARMCKEVMLELKALKMATTELRVSQQELPETLWSEHGTHGVTFEVATNKGLSFGALNKVASGGELSRLLLAMKVVLRGTDVATAIFDEIDAGTGGAVAEAIGVRLKKLSADAQVLVVTHLPQVAAQADHHLFIEKSGGKQVATSVRSLTDKERTEELARMLSGEVITNEARQVAYKLRQAAS